MMWFINLISVCSRSSWTSQCIGSLLWDNNVIFARCYWPWTFLVLLGIYVYLFNFTVVSVHINLFGWVVASCCNNWNRSNILFVLTFSDQLKRHYNLGHYWLEVELEDLTHFDASLAEKIVKQPAENMPLVIFVHECYERVHYIYHYRYIHYKMHFWRMSLWWNQGTVVLIAFCLLPAKQLFAHMSGRHVKWFL